MCGIGIAISLVLLVGVAAIHDDGPDLPMTSRVYFRYCSARTTR
jgi:hypothetical protein